MASQKCSHCGAAAGITAKFCKECGRPLHEHVAESSPAAETLTEESIDRLGSEAPAASLAEEPVPTRAPSESSVDGGGEVVHEHAVPSNGFAVEVVNGLSAGARVAVRKGSVLSVGAADGAGLQINGDSGVSRKHLSFEVRNGQLFVRDEGSTNGTFVHVTTDREIGVGDTIVVGATLLKIVPGE